MQRQSTEPAPLLQQQESEHRTALAHCAVGCLGDKPLSCRFARMLVTEMNRQNSKPNPSLRCTTLRHSIIMVCVQASCISPIFLLLCCTSQRWTTKEIPHRQPAWEPLLSAGILRGKAQEGGQNRIQPGFIISYCFQILFYFILNRLFLTLLEGPWPICLLV